MATNVLSIITSDSGKTFPLRGSMDVALNLKPTQKFSVSFVTYTSETFVFTSTNSQFRQLDGSFASTFVMGGGVSKFVKMAYNASANSWDIIAHNLVSGSGAGAIGPQGPAGPPGPMGTPGGPTGPTGATGSQGIQGPAGPQGIQGPTGTNGTGTGTGTSVAGPQGIQGATGPAGPQGIQGNPGANGVNGTSGTNGSQGPAGPAGSQGIVGATGPQGIQGPAGTTTSGTGTGAGPAGPQGATGPAGPQGPTGPAGPQGSIGATGPIGSSGLNGSAGPQGVAGVVGPQGTSGVNGSTGPTGAAGPQGPAGSTTATTVAIGNVTTGAPGSQAQVVNVGTPSAAVLDFSIPQGTAGGATTPGGGSYSPEVLITQNAQGQITLDKGLGNNFRVLLTQNGKMMDPIGFSEGDEIHVAVRQSPLGPFTLSWGLVWAHPDRQIPVLAKQPGSLNKITALLTAAIDTNNPGGWMTDISPAGSVNGYGIPSFVARNITTGTQYYVLRSPTLPAATTEMRNTDTLLILRNSLGIEAYGAVDGGVNGPGPFLITGVMPNGSRAELRTGPGVRAAFDKGVLAATGLTIVTVQDIVLSGAREQSGFSHIAQGFSVGSGNATVTLKNVLLYNNENGLLSSNDYTGRLSLIDCVLDNNGFGNSNSSSSPDGSTHNIYFGHTSQEWSALRTTFSNAGLSLGNGSSNDIDGGHNIKSRAGITTLNQVRTYSSAHGREMDIPNGGVVHATDCIFEHPASCTQNDCIRIGGEGVDTSRPRDYIFRNCHFIQGKPSANAASYIWNEDPGVTVQCIDCTFTGVGQWAVSDANGMTGLVSVTFTGGPVGPRMPAGYFVIPVTAVP